MRVWRVESPRGRWVLVQHARRIRRGRAVDEVQLGFGDVTAEMPPGFRFPPGADRQMPRVHHQKVVDLDQLKEWIPYQADKKAQAALVNFVAWAESIAEEMEGAVA